MMGGNRFLKMAQRFLSQACDCVFVFSVGGGNLEKNVSANLVRALVCLNL